jgi:replicative DNA helicase
MQYSEEFNSQLRIPPQSLEAESSVLGALLLDNKSFDHIADLVTFKDFYRAQHQTIFNTIAALINTARPADVITVYEYLKNNGGVEDAGGLDYLNGLAQYIPSAGNIRRYAELVRDKSILRKLIQTGDEIAALAFEYKGQEPTSILEEAERKVLEIGEQGASRAEVKTLDDQITRFIDQLQERADNPGQKTGVQSGFIDLDRLTNGFQAGDLIVIAGRPSMGKTAVGLNIAQHAAIEQKLATLIISLEMSADQLTSRFVGAIARVDQDRFKTGVLSEGEWGRVTNTLETVRGAILDIQDSGLNTVSSIRALARRTTRKYKHLGLIVVDYIQLMGGAEEGRASAENRATEVAQISRGLKLLAKEMRCPVIALSQLNRGVESRPDKRPMMADLRESGAIEQDADTIIFIYRDEVYTKDACKEPGVAEIIIGKQRNGPTGTVKLAWSPKYTRFDNLARGS